MIWYDKYCPFCLRESYTANPYKRKWECPYCLKTVNDSADGPVPAFINPLVPKELVRKSFAVAANITFR